MRIENHLALKVRAIGFLSSPTLAEFCDAMFLSKSEEQ